MSIYSTDTYQIVSIMNNFITSTDNVTTFDNAIIFTQVLPKALYPYIVPTGIHIKYGLVEDDYNVYDRFIANVIPIFETVCYPSIANVQPEGTRSLANSAISPISMLSSGATV